MAWTSPSEQYVTAMDSRAAQSFRRPNPAVFALEGVRVSSELACFTALWPFLRRLPRGDGRPVLVLPGFTASDTSTEPLRCLLGHLGYDAYDWLLGQNLGPTPRIVKGLLQRFDTIRATTAQPVTIIGWSLGGLYARALADRCAADVRHVVTLGSPFRLARSEETNAGRLFDALSPLHRQERAHTTTFRREPYHGAPPVPSTAIFSRTDGVVPWRSCVDEPGRQSENVEVRGSHCGLGMNPAVMVVLADRLQLGVGEWRPFEPGLISRRLHPATPYVV